MSLVNATDVALLIALGLGIVAFALIVVFVGRRFVLGVLAARMERRIARVRSIIDEAARREYADMDRLMFQLGELPDRYAVRQALDELIEKKGVNDTPLDVLYQKLGLVDEYLHDLRNAPKWTRRANAARALGELRVVKALPALVAALRDPQEDERTVKTAVAGALAKIDALEAIPVLLSELRAPDAWASPRIAEMLVRFGPDAVPQLVDALDGDANANVRMWAAQILGRIADPSAVRHLRAHVRDRSEQVRMSIAEALGSLRDPRAINDLVELTLKDPVAPVRAEAARALGKLDDTSVVESLITLFDDPDYWTRLRAVEAIEMLAPKDPEALDAALRDPSPEVRGRAAMALERIGFLSARVEDLASKDRMVVDRAHRTLVEMGRAGLVESILFHVESSDLRVRSRIAEALGEIGDPQANDALTGLLRDGAWPVRLRAVEAIAKLRPSGAVKLLVEQLDDPEESVRAAIVDAIRTIGLNAEPGAADLLITAFETDNAEVRRAVVQTVGSDDSPAVDTLLDRALLDPNRDVRLQAVVAIESRPTEEWTVTLIGQLSDPDPDVRAEVVRMLGVIGTPAALEGVTLNLHTEDAKFRDALTDVLSRQGIEKILGLVGRPRGLETSLALVEALGKTANPLAIDRLAELAEHDDAKIRAEAGRALAKIADARAEAPLLRLLADRDEATRAAAASGLIRVATEAAAPQLETALLDPDVEVRGLAAIALGSAGPASRVETLRRLVDGDDHEVAACAVIGLGLLGAFDAAIAGLGRPALVQRVERRLGELPDALRDRFRQSLHLERSDGGVSFDDVGRQYASSIRSSQDENERLAAVRGVLTIGARPHRLQLIDAVRTDPSAAVRAAALEGLTSIPNEEDVGRVLVDALKDPATSVRVVAAEGLGARPSAANNGPLLACLRGGDERLFGAVVDALARANGGRVSELMDEIMGHDDVNVLRGGAATLGAIGDPRALGLLVSWSRSQDARLRTAAVEGLAGLGVGPARDAVLDARTDPDHHVRVAVVRSLFRLAGDEVERARAELCRDPSILVRRELAARLATSTHLSSLDLAETLVADPHDEIRVQALLALLLMENAAAVLRFEAVTDGIDEQLRRQLRAIGREHPAVDATERLFTSTRNNDARVAGFRALAMLSATSDEILAAAARDPIPKLRIAALQACVEMEHSMAETLVEQLLRDPDSDVQENARRIRIAPIDSTS